jgi:2-phosphosulfolactate phosphatase
MREWLGQREFAVRMDWGLQGAQAIGRDADFVVIVDVLSFTTTVSVAIDQGAEVFPYPWRDESARAFARRQRAVLAVGRSEVATVRAAGARTDPAAGMPSAVSDLPQVSLSPASIRATSGLERIVLPSPNGSALVSALAGADQSIRGVQRAHGGHRAQDGDGGQGGNGVGGDHGAKILGACLRNRTAVASWLARQASRSASPAVIAVVAAGERWPDNSLRPAVEDLWGAGAVIAALDSLGVTGLSPEARSAAAAWRAVERALAAALAGCTSGVELVGAGFGGDVAIAGELDASTCVPLLAGGRFADAAKAPLLGS